MILKKADKIRKKLMPKLTQNIGKSHYYKKVKGTQKTEIKTILINRPNQRLGNILLITPLIQELVTLFPECEIDVIVKGSIAKPILQEYLHIRNIIILPRKPFKELFKYLKIFFSVKTKKYDLAINGDEGSSSGKILTYLSNAKYKVFGRLVSDSETPTEDDYCHMAKQTVYNLRHYLNQIGYTILMDSIPDLNLKLNDKELSNGNKMLTKLVERPEKNTISIFTYATGSKCYSNQWWLTFYEKLKVKYGDSYNILEILPIENVSKIDFATSSFYSKNIRDIASVIAHTKLFIGADSGIMHLASASQTTTIGLFSVSNPQKYKPYNSTSDYIDTNNTDYDACLEIIDKKLNHHMVIC
ncbi:glycosyltransferase family 9 protein [Psychroserpens sp. SPM9]|uniref:glycosyltransferase family 9 protein n=1 Tax=Psychroserpens sp. SPM9 TaxID=2975598 RepID=UPI0021A4C0D6|nr:glycosyltransferase family 9 protein [Psychroserpens sp. SPM9]MDG5491837.1 glycosyltransferase family 9 protein [Psychroserpens sp. SPM9]